MSYVQLQSGIIVPEDFAIQEEPPVGIDLFCGAGGFSCGFVQAGFRIGAAVDNDPHCVLTYLSNLGSHPVQIHYIEDEDRERLEKVAQKTLKAGKHSEDAESIYLPLVSGSGWISTLPDPERLACRHFFFGDATRLTGQQILTAIGMERGDIDCVFGGPPCQGFSTMGKRDVMDPRNSMVMEFCRLCTEIQPKTFVMENVPGIISMKTPEGIPVLDAMALAMERGGMGTYKALRTALAGSDAKVGVRQSLAKKPTAEKPEDQLQLALA